MEIPQTIFGFFRILVSKPPHKFRDLDHFPMLQNQQLAWLAMSTMKKLLRELSKHADMTWIHCDNKEWDPIGRESHIYSWDRDTIIYWDSAVVRDKLRLVVGTSLRGRMIMVSFCDLYDYLCSNMICDLMSCMNRRQLLLIHDDYLIQVQWYEYDESNVDRGRWAKLFLPCLSSQGMELR